MTKLGKLGVYKQIFSQWEAVNFFIVFSANRVIDTNYYSRIDQVVMNGCKLVKVYWVIPENHIKKDREFLCQLSTKKAQRTPKSGWTKKSELLCTNSKTQKGICPTKKWRTSAY
jgi:hypothetical protein